MTKIDLTNAIYSNYKSTKGNSSIEEKHVVEYFITDNLKKILGDSFVELKKDEQIGLSHNAEGGPSIDIKLLSGNYCVKIANINDEEGVSTVLCCYKDEAPVFTLRNKNDVITNEVEYEEDNNTYTVSKSVILKNTARGNRVCIDAVEFSLSKKINGNLMYEGKLLPIFARIGAIDCFDFREGKEAVETTPSFIERLYSSLISDNVVSVSTDKESHKLVDNISNIFNVLNDKLEKRYIGKSIKRSLEK